MVCHVGDRYCFPLQRVFDVLHNDLYDVFMACAIVTQRSAEGGNEGNAVDGHSSPRTSPRTLVRQTEAGMANVSVISISDIANASTRRDLFDEGTISNQQELVNYVKRFDELFYVPKDVERHCILGNHDIGFHDEISQARLQFLSEHFLRSFADHIVIGGNHFVLLNSMTVERDGCPLCIATERQIEQLSSNFDCAGNVTVCNTHAKPIVLLHMPLYRESDAHCPDDYDSTPEAMKRNRFHAGVDCLSNVSSQYILEKLKPRAVFNGHAHYSCRTWWPSPYNMYEWTLSSFSWRNIPQPAFFLVTVVPDEIQRY
ncbi:unnamed protein product [Litomosoides sigmodontis]|uniref:Calcineurin-like phosphoesterase domain-containing protein n=1 Tax=Litomosoides sigmodontis TaxID=42156 RepID=A0A3P7JYH6_LITSI|nr:unnamed protein product [Litomosoides sigmodontis]